MNEILLYAGAAIVAIWGVAHLFPTKAVVRGFGDISQDNRQLIRMEWMAEGIALIFIGAVVFLATAAGGPGDAVARIIYFASATASLAIAVLALFTGARTRIVPVKLCPVVMSVTAALILAGCLL
jgi:hypothetical protein